MLCSYIIFNDNGKYSIGSDIKSKDIKDFHKDIHVPFCPMANSKKFMHVYIDASKIT